MFYSLSIGRCLQVRVMSMFGVGSGGHVIVVGGGLAGLSATIEAVAHGATVTIVEKEERLGGNSAKATSGQTNHVHFRFSQFVCVFR